MIATLRYTERDGDDWDARTEVTIEQHKHFRYFQGQRETATLAARANQEAGVWMEIAFGREYESGG